MLIVLVVHTAILSQLPRLHGALEDELDNLAYLRDYGSTLTAMLECLTLS